MNKRYDVLDSFRGISAIMVAILHLKVVGVVTNLNFVKNAGFFVEFFFVLSGFVIALTYSDKLKNKSDFKIFLKKRFARIWPLHAFMTVLFIPFAIANHFLEIVMGDMFSIFAFANNLVLLQAFGLNDGETWNIPAWSISVEFYTYMLFAVIVVLAANKLTYVSLLISMLSVLILSYFSSMGDVSQFVIFRCSYSFFIGVIAFKVHKKEIFKSNTILEIVTIAIVISFFALQIVNTDSLLAYLSPMLFFWVILVFSQESGLVSKCLKNRYFIKIGELSFSIYLTHAFFISSLKALSIVLDKVTGFSFMYPVDGVRTIDFGLGVINDLVYIPYLVIVVAMSWCTYTYVEKTAQAYLNRHLT